MLRTLGRQFAAVAPEVDLVIGFAETATAVGAVVASMLSDECRYIHTTREPAAASSLMIEFQEEHSHATEQFLCLDQLGEWLREANSIAFVDDELSTGKTLLNIISAIGEQFPEIKGKNLWAVSIINRLTDERTAVMEAHGVRCFSLLRLPMTDLTSAVEKYTIQAPKAVVAKESSVPPISLPPTTLDTRYGAMIGDFITQCHQLAESIYQQLDMSMKGKHISVIGTEEWMLPGFLLGEYIESKFENTSVRFHATTRSPIGICTDAEYPIQSGISLHSFYESTRSTFLYNLQPSDAVIILTDSADEVAIRHAYTDLCGAYASICCTNIILFKEAAHVRHLST